VAHVNRITGWGNFGLPRVKPNLILAEAGFVSAGMV
jgi:hypothetical protein